MGFSSWDIEKLTQDYRQRKQYQHIPPQIEISKDFDLCNPLLAQDRKNIAHLTYYSDTDFLITLEKELPPVFSRQVASKLTGGLVSVKTLSNLDSLDRGPSRKVKIGAKVGYERANFIQWLRGRMR